MEKLDFFDLERIDDIDKLGRILRESEDQRLVEETLDRVCQLRTEDGIDIVRACLPGKCTWTLLRFLSRETKETP